MRVGEGFWQRRQHLAKQIWMTIQVAPMPGAKLNVLDEEEIKLGQYSLGSCMWNETTATPVPPVGSYGIANKRGPAHNTSLVLNPGLQTASPSTLGPQ